MCPVMNVGVRYPLMDIRGQATSGEASLAGERSSWLIGRAPLLLASPHRPLLHQSLGGISVHRAVTRGRATAWQRFLRLSDNKGPNTVGYIYIFLPLSRARPQLHLRHWQTLKRTGWKRGQTTLLVRINQSNVSPSGLTLVILDTSGLKCAWRS